MQLHAQPAAPGSGLPSIQQMRLRRRSVRDHRWPSVRELSERRRQLTTRLVRVSAHQGALGWAGKLRRVLGSPVTAPPLLARQSERVEHHQMLQWV